MKTSVEVTGKCPHCSGDKLRETMITKINPYPPTQQIIGPGFRDQMVKKVQTTIYCQNCFTIFKS